MFNSRQAWYSRGSALLRTHSNLLVEDWWSIVTYLYNLSLSSWHKKQVDAMGKKKRKREKEITKHTDIPRNIQSKVAMLFAACSSSGPRTLYTGIHCTASLILFYQMFRLIYHIPVVRWLPECTNIIWYTLTGQFVTQQFLRPSDNNKTNTQMF